MRIFIQIALMNAQQIKDWLELSGHDRQWLADRCGVKQSTVDGWLSANRPLSSAAKKTVQNLMHGAEHYQLTMDLTEFEALRTAAKLAGEPDPMTWLKRVAKQAAEEIKKTAPPLVIGLIVEPPEKQKPNPLRK